MSSTATATERLESARRTGFAWTSRVFSFLRWPRSGVRGRLIALITLLVAGVVVITTIANVAHLTGVIISRTEEQVAQISAQISYAARQQLASNLTVNAPNPYAVLASENSDVRNLMESTLVTSREVAYLYLAGVSGQIITNPEGADELGANLHMVGDRRVAKPPLSQLARENALVQLARVFFGPPVYEYQRPVREDGVFEGFLHIGVSSAEIRRELTTPVITNLLIGLLALLVATAVALSSANLLLKPLRLISTSIDKLERGDDAEAAAPDLPNDKMVTGVTSRLRQLGERMAGDRSELEIMRGRLRQVISHLEERLLLVNREGRVMLASPDAEQLLGLDGAEITGLHLDDSLGADHPISLLVARAFDERRSIPRATLRLRAGDVPRQLLASVRYIEDAGVPVGAMVSLRDYESFRKFESQWDHSKKVLDLWNLTSGTAHEVKNPLNAMVIHLEILRSKLESGDADPGPQLEILDSEIKRLDRVVATFLDFTRPVEMHLQPADLSSIVSQVVALASTEARERGVTIHYEANGPLMAKVDTDLLKQALLNIIINGCHAMPEGGPLKITTTRGPDGSVRITVADRGIGIAPEVRDRVFNLYYTTKKGGTGIGLAQTFRAVQLHNGSIRFESEVGVGTSFEITLPVSD